jgi:hypothetical protein
MADWKPPWTPQQQYKFTGTLNDAGEPHQKLSFYVLAGVGAPTPTGGWAKINTIDRARRKGFTMPIGYDPAAMDVPVRFEATVDYGAFGWTPAQLEHDIQVLEWMAGRGKLYANGTHPAQGDPPIVQVSSFQADSQSSTNLIPPNFHSDGANDLRWLISNLQYDSGAIRGPLGDRHRQDITVSLVEYVAVPGAPTSPKQRQQGRGNVTGFKTYTTNAAVNTIAMLCLQHGIDKTSLWQQVVTFNQKRLKVRSYNQALKPGTKVHIPSAVFAS